jgi:hypothetical protein
MPRSFEDVFNCEFCWDLRAKPYVWVTRGHDTPMGRAIGGLGEIERRELACQLYSVLGRGERHVLINGVRYALCRDTFFTPEPEHYPEAA